MRAHVDTARGLVEDQELRFGQQPAREENLLLITAREELDGLFRARGTYTELADEALGNRVLLALRDRTQPAALGL